jgi:hypothetical protein
MSLKSIIQQKDSVIESVIDDFDREFKTLTWETQRVLLELYQQGDFSDAAIREAFGLFSEVPEKFLEQHTVFINLNKEIAGEIGFKFLLTPENIANYDAIQTANLDSLGGSINQSIASVRKIMIESRLQGDTAAQITAKLTEEMEGLARNIGTEIQTGIRTADAVIKAGMYETAGIDRFVYIGALDNKTRPACEHTLNSPNQETGWTKEQIAASEVNYITRGGWNCRHDWVPYVGKY